MRVQAAAVAVFAFAGFPLALDLAELAGAFGLRREDARAADFLAQQTGGGQRVVAHDFRFQAQPRLPRQQVVGRDRFPRRSGRISEDCR